ncbi:MAG: three-Cys-motif partner protein TcmP [Nanoarchaeota archaeon]|nr:three-Cys-motif partner protein TcmP [Nanoarchaeota archaeon]
MKVAPHTSLKHRTLGMYFYICRRVMRRRRLYYVDLYAGDGECTCDEAPHKEWKCPFIKSLLHHAKKEDLDLICFLNDLDTDNFKKLKENTAPYKPFIGAYTNRDANAIYPLFLHQIPKDEWSIFFMDPYKHSDLDWNTIEGISKHVGYDRISKCHRKPELIINLMTLSMQRTIKCDPNSITKALGTDDWKDRIKNKNDEKIHEIFLGIFTENLGKLGYSATPFLIKQTPPNQNVLYYLIFASSIPRANEIIIKKFRPYVEKIMKEEWVKENFEYRMITKARKRGNKLLTDFEKET